MKNINLGTHFLLLPFLTASIFKALSKNLKKSQCFSNLSNTHPYALTPSGLNHKTELLGLGQDLFFQHNTSILLFSGSKWAAGYDLYSAYDSVIPSQGKVIAKTDISIRVPDGTYGRVAPRSGLSAKHHIDVGAGVIDQDYTGNVGVVLFNHAAADFEIKKGDRVAQLICEKIEYPEIEEVKTLGITERGEGGFGSTGSS